jgi:hypothetical protein
LEYEQLKKKTERESMWALFEIENLETQIKTLQSEIESANKKVIFFFFIWLT